MFETTVIESRRRKIRIGRLATLPLSIALHLATVGGVLVANVWAVVFPSAAPTQMVLYSIATPPPPPPPPPPPKRAAAQPVKKVEPKPVDPREMMAPTMIPDEIPDLMPPAVQSFEGIEGGVEGGVEGGEIGGVMGGVLGGVVPEKGPTDPSGLYRAEYDIAKPFFTSQVFPEYPEGPRLRGITGVVIVDYIIGVDGRVREVRVLQDPHPDLTKAAVSAIRRWRVKPAMVDGRPVEVIHKLSIIFELE
jgi:protein TonB